jgi:hypothetical protein
VGDWFTSKHFPQIKNSTIHLFSSTKNLNICV